MDAVVVFVMRFMSVKSYKGKTLFPTFSFVYIEFICLMSYRCFKGEIIISNAFSATKILFDPTTETC